MGYFVAKNSLYYLQGFASVANNVVKGKVSLNLLCIFNFVSLYTQIWINLKHTLSAKSYTQGQINRIHSHCLHFNQRTLFNQQFNISRAE